MIYDYLDKDIDLKYFMSDELQEIIDPLIESISYAISNSIRETEKAYEREMRNRF